MSKRPFDKEETPSDGELPSANDRPGVEAGRRNDTREDPVSVWRSDRDIQKWMGELKRSVDTAGSLVARADEDTFLEDDVFQAAAAAVIIRIGEAANSLPQEFKDLYPEMAWKAAYAMRIRFAHNYPGQDMRILWDTLNKHVLAMRNQLDLDSW